MKKNIAILIIFSIFYFNCSIFKSADNNKNRTGLSSYTCNYKIGKVWSSLLKTLEDLNYRIAQSDELKGEIQTEKITYKRDDIETFQKLKEVSDIPKSPLSEYFEASYFLNIKLGEEKVGTKVEIDVQVSALERGRFNKWINLKSNGQKEKEIFSALIKKLREF